MHVQYSFTVPAYRLFRVGIQVPICSRDGGRQPIGETSERSSLQQVLIAGRLEPHPHHRHTRNPPLYPTGHVLASRLQSCPLCECLFCRALCCAECMRPLGPEHKRRAAAALPAESPAALLVIKALDPRE